MKTGYVLIFLFLSSFFNLAQNQSWYTYFNGETAGTIAFEDNILWISSFYGTLTKYNKDNGETTIYSYHNHEVPGFMIYSVAVDHYSNKWIGTWGYGVGKFDNNNWMVYYPPNLSSTSIIPHVDFDKEGNVWCSTDSDGLYQYDGENWTVFNISNSGLPTNALWEIIIDNDDNKWVGSLSGDLIMYDNESWTVYDNTNSCIPDDSMIWDISINDHGTIWLALRFSGAIRFENGIFTHFTVENSGLPGNQVSCIDFDDMGNTWLATDSGLAVFDNQNWTVYNKDNSCLPENTIKFIAHDEEGSRYICTYDNGTYIFDGAHCDKIKTSNSLLPPWYNQPLEMIKDINSTLWMSHEDYGITSFDGNEWRNYNAENSSFPFNVTTCIKADRENNLWASDSGIAKLDGSEWVYYNSDNSGLPCDNITSIAFDENNYGWFGTSSQGIIKYDGGNWQIIDSTNSGLSDSRITDIEIDSNEVLWIGTGNGVFCFDGEQWEHFTTLNSSLPSDIISSIDIDQFNTIWIKTPHAFAKVSDNTWEIFNEHNTPLPNGYYICMTVDDFGNVWFSGYPNGALYKFDGINWTIYHDEFAFSVQIKICGLAVKQNTIYLLTKYGLTAFINGAIVPVELTSFSAQNSGGNILLKWSTATETNNFGFEVEKSYNNQNFSKIAFISGNGTSSENHVYSFSDQAPGGSKCFYRLKQLDYDGAYEYSQTIEIDVNPAKFALEQNYPNPFNPSTKIKYSLPTAEFVTLKIYDALGSEAATLVNKKQDAGSYEIEFDAASNFPSLASGVYLYTLKAGKYSQTKKMLLIK